MRVLCMHANNSRASNIYALITVVMDKITSIDVLGVIPRPYLYQFITIAVVCARKMSLFPWLPQSPHAHGTKT